jgi:hypothetical protein
MATNWPKISAIIGCLILLWAIFSSTLVQNLIFNKNSEDVNSYITLQKTKNAHFSDIISDKYLNVLNYQPDTLKDFNFPDSMTYGEQVTFNVRIDGNDEFRKIKVFLIDPNNIIRFADEKTASYINSNLNNESIFETNSVIAQYYVGFIEAF